jgi:hypothetical protein
MRHPGVLLGLQAVLHLHTPALHRLLLLLVYQHVLTDLRPLSCIQSRVAVQVAVEVCSVGCFWGRGRHRPFWQGSEHTNICRRLHMMGSAIKHQKMGCQVTEDTRVAALPTTFS